MLITRLRGTPDDWRPSGRTVRYVRGRSIFTAISCGTLSLASLGATLVLAARGAFEISAFGLDALLPFSIAILVTGGFGAAMAWLAYDATGAWLRFLELDWDAGRMLVASVRGIDGAPLVPTPAPHVATLGTQMQPRFHTMGFDEVKALVIVRLEQRTVVVDQYQRYLNMRVEPMEALVALPAGITLYVDEPVFGRIRDIADALSRGLRVPLTERQAEPPLPLPAPMRAGMKVSVALAGRGPLVGYLSAATTEGARRPDVPNYVVMLAHGESVTVEPFQVTPA